MTLLISRLDIGAVSGDGENAEINGRRDAMIATADFIFDGISVSLLADADAAADLAAAMLWLTMVG